MGGKSSSSSSNTTHTEQRDERVAAEDGGIAVGANSTIEITALDSGLVGAFTEALAFAGTTVGEFTALQADTIGSLSDIAEQNSERSDQVVAGVVATVAIAVAIGLAVTAIFSSEGGSSELARILNL